MYCSGSSAQDSKHGEFSATRGRRDASHPAQPNRLTQQALQVRARSDLTALALEALQQRALIYEQLRTTENQTP